MITASVATVATPGSWIGRGSDSCRLPAYTNGRNGPQTPVREHARNTAADVRGASAEFVRQPTSPRGRCPRKGPRESQGCPGSQSQYRTDGLVDRTDAGAGPGTLVRNGDDERPVRRAANDRETRTRKPTGSAGGLDIPVVLLLMVVLLSIAGFVFWYWDRTADPRLALSPEAPAIHLQPSEELQAPPIQEQATNSPSAAAQVAVPPMNEQRVEPIPSPQQPQPEAQAVTVAPTPAQVAVPAQPQVAASEEPASKARQAAEALQSAEPPTQALAAPQRNRTSASERDRTITRTAAATHTVTGGRRTAVAIPLPPIPSGRGNHRESPVRPR